MPNLPDNLVCWKCGAAITDTPFPLGRTSVCRSCDAELHVCKLCEFFDTTVANQCREPIAELVTDKARANFCDYFQPKPNAYTQDTKAAQAQAQLQALFGDQPQNADESEQAQSADDLARKKLENLFKK